MVSNDSILSLRSNDVAVLILVFLIILDTILDSAIIARRISRQYFAVLDWWLFFLMDLHECPNL